MASPTYLAGYIGKVKVPVTTTTNGTTTTTLTELPIQGWKSSDDPGLWDATNSTTNGWSKQERGIKKITFTFTIVCKVADGVPNFEGGDIIEDIEFSINSTTKYAGNVIVAKFDTNPDQKGGVTFDITADSDGPMTGLND